MTRRGLFSRFIAVFLAIMLATATVAFGHEYYEAEHDNNDCSEGFVWQDDGFMSIEPAIADRVNLQVGELIFRCYYTHIQLNTNETFDITWSSLDQFDLNPLWFEYNFDDIWALAPDGWEMMVTYLVFTTPSTGVPGSGLVFTEGVENSAPVTPMGNGIWRYTFPSGSVSPFTPLVPPPSITVRIRPEGPTLDKASAIISPSAVPLLPGDIIAYTLTIQNHAVTPMYGVSGWLVPLINFDGFQFSDTLPPGLAIYTDFEPIVTPPSVLVGSVGMANNTISATLNLHGSNESNGNDGIVNITFRAYVTCNVDLNIGELSNTARLNGPNTDMPVYSTDINATGTQPSLTKEIVYPIGEEVANGDEITYNLRVHNPNPRTITNYYVTDTIPNGLQLNLSSINVSPATALYHNNSSGNIVSLELDLPPGYTDITFTVTVVDTDYATDYEFENTAYLFGRVPPITLDHPVERPRPYIDSDDASIDVAPYTPTPATLKGTVTCEDTGRDIPDATVRLYILEDDEWVFVAMTLTNLFGMFDFGEVLPGYYELRISDIPYGYALRHGGIRSFTILAGVDHEEDFLVGASVLQITKSVVPATAIPGNTVTYTFVIDTGEKTAAEFRYIKVEDVLHSNLIFNDSSMTVVGVDSFEHYFDPETRILTVYNMELSYNDGYAATVVITFTAQVAAHATPGNIPNTVALFDTSAGVGAPPLSTSAALVAVVLAQTAPPALPPIPPSGSGLSPTPDPGETTTPSALLPLVRRPGSAVDVPIEPPGDDPLVVIEIPAPPMSVEDEYVHEPGIVPPIDNNEDGPRVNPQTGDRFSTGGLVATSAGLLLSISASYFVLKSTGKKKE